MKYCTNCGSPNEDNANNCTNCGNVFESATPPPPPPPPKPEAPEMNDDGIVYTVNNAPPPLSQPPLEGVNNPAKLWLILNIILTVLCGCLGQVPGIIGIVFSALGMESFNKGDLEDAEKKAKVAKIMFFVGLGLFLLITILYVVFFAAMFSGVGGMEAFVDEFN